MAGCLKDDPRNTLLWCYTSFFLTFDSVFEILPVTTERNVSYCERSTDFLNFTFVSGDNLVPGTSPLASGPGQSPGEKSWDRD